ncbi:hypothetical protein BCON_0009g00740 [Botryotinia convoluta]|uniref:Uncharacterized protein n=1 Tax=Botryotinia convoluta TaxID=54673 RepID=A0A4Z1IRU5_9HELO|nr:hypothetical protein BCON_0009g00740 [Botryotinia convoluta]
MSLIEFTGSWLRAVLFPHGNAAVKAPIVGLRWAYPARVQYLNNAMNLLQEGYHQVKPSSAPSMTP